jgi:hypothetical protein
VGEVDRTPSVHLLLTEELPEPPLPMARVHAGIIKTLANANLRGTAASGARLVYKRGHLSWASPGEFTVWSVRSVGPKA